MAAGMAAWVVGSAAWWRLAWAFTVDDAYISARYAQQWVAGNGLVFNLGERVEGFSNFTWVCLLALLELLGLPFEAGVKCLGLAAGAAAALGMLAVLTRRLSVTGVLPALVAGAWLGLDPAFAVWTIGGLETPLFAALLVWTLYHWLDEAPPTRARTVTLAVLLSLIAWTRPEGPAVAIGLLGLTPLCFRAAAARRARVTACGIALLVVLAGFLARRWYYAAWWPNPYYVKLGGGWDQVREGLGYWAAAVGRRGGPALLAWLALPLLLPAPTDSVRRGQRVLVLVWVGYSLFIMRSGREPFPFHRFMVPLIPLAIVAGAPAFQAVAARGIGPRAIVWLLAGACMGVAPLAARGHWKHLALLTDITRNISVPFGRWVGATRDLPSTVGVFWAGALPYAAGPEVHALDMGGLCDGRIARAVLPWPERNHGHTKHDFAYLLERQPTYVTDDALHTLDALIALGGPRAERHAAHRAAFLAAYTRLNDHLFVRVQHDTRERFARYLTAFPEDAEARAAQVAFSQRPRPADPPR